MAARDLDERIDALYGLPLEEFVPARDALAKELRGEKRREEAAEVKALRRPGVAAWAVNQVVRTQGSAVRELWTAGDELVEAQRALVAGDADRTRLRDAMAGRREALAPVVAALRGLLGGRGKGLAEGTVQEAVETLTAASVDPAVRERVAQGRLGETVATTGFEAVADPGSEPEPGSDPKPAKPEKRAPKQPSAAERRKAEAARKAEAEAARRRRDARRSAKRALEKAVRARESAAARAEKAEAALHEAQDAERAAREELEAAAAGEAEAREAVERLEAEGD